MITATPILFGSSWRGQLGGRSADVIIRDSKSRKTRRIEVKATGRHAFQELKDKDLNADALVWIRFGCRFEMGSGAVEVVVVEAPGKHIKSPCRLDVRRFEAIPGICRNQRVFRFDSLDAMLTAADRVAGNATIE